MTVDGAVVERRLRPIYEWLDLGHTRKAIQECDKVLKKQPGLHCAIVLRGLALLRSGKHEDAEQAIGQVVTAAPTDDSTLQALTIFFRETHQLEKICMVYEEATKKQSNNEELLSHLFMSYVRVGNYKKQQHIAMALYKLKPKNPYYFWAVISIVMQAREHDVGSSNRRVCLTLAERMVERFYKEGKLEAEAEVLAYLYILELQSKYVEALDVLDTDLSDKITQQPANFLPLRRVRYHLALQHWQQARDMCRDLIEQERDNWQHYENYCLCSVHLQAAAATAADDHEKDEVNVLLKAVDHLRCVQRNSEQQCGSKYRAPYLALLQLVWQMKQQGMLHLLQHIEVDVGEELLAYLSRYGSKWCPFSDVRRFFLLLPRHSVALLLQKLRDLVTLDDDGIPTDVNMLHRHLTWLQVSRCLLKTPEKNAHDHLVTAAQLFHLYESTQHLASQTTATDIRRNDMYLLLCSHSVLHALTLLSNENSEALQIESSEVVSPALNSSIDPVTCSNSDAEPDCNGSNTPKCNGGEPAPDCKEQNCVGSSKQPHDSACRCKTVSDLLLKLCGVLEAAVASSRANFQLKLLLLQVYNMMGACGSGRNCYESLEVKSVQLDTLGPVLALQALDSAHYSLASSIFSATISFFMAAAKDTCEPMIQAYKFGSLTRIPEFGQFRDRLEHSVLFATVTAEQMILDLTYTVASHSAALSLLEQQSIDPVTDKTDYDSLVDNTDYGVKVSWDYVFSDLNADEDDSDCTSSGCDGIVSSSGSRGPRKPRTAVLHELQLRNATLRLLGAAHNTAAACVQPQSRGEDTPSDVGVDGSLQQLSKVTDELEQLQQQKSPAPAVLDCHQLGGARLLHGSDGGGYGGCVALHGKLLLDLHRCYTPQSAVTPRPLYSPNRLDCCRASLAALLQRSAQQLQMLQCTAVTACLGSASALHVLHHTMQTVGTVLILLGFSCTVIRSTRPTGKKTNKKKKKEVSTQNGNTCDLSGYLQWLQQELECHQTALLAKLDTAKRNSRNHATILYPRIVPTFDCLSRNDCSVGGKTDGNGEADVDHNINAEVQKLSELSLDDRPQPNSVDGGGANNSKKSAGKKRSSGKKEAVVASVVNTNDREDSAAAGVLSPFKPDFVKTCLTIDASYQESLANLSNAVASKLKYIASLKL